MHYQLATRFGRNAHQISGREPLDNEALYRHVPSIFAREAHDSRSDRYVYVPTIDIVEGLRREGWFPFFAVQSVPRDGNRRNLSGDGRDLGGGFGTEVRAAMEVRAGHLADEGLARRQGQRIIFARNLLDTLRRRELDTTAKGLSAEIGLPHTPSKAGEFVAGTVRQRLTLTSGRFGMIDNGLGFQLVPWSPSLDRQIGKHISGVMRGDGGVDWSFGRGRGLGL